MKKYEITDEKMKIDNVIVHRIRALRDFAGVKQGDLGGFIESENNLTHNGNAWVMNEARVFGRARVWGNAQVLDHAVVCDCALIANDAVVSGNAHVSGEARVSGRARVSGGARVSNTAWAMGDTHVFGDAWVIGNARIADHAQVSGDTVICGDAQVVGDSRTTGGRIGFGCLNECSYKGREYEDTVRSKNWVDRTGLANDQFEGCSNSWIETSHLAPSGTMQKR